ncbi:MAG TPA: helix-turn-helix transcriptional regulator [Thermoleophilaceae bacterium]
MPRTNSSSVTQSVVGHAIREARTGQGLTQAELAERLDAAPAYVSAIEAGRENLTLGSLARIASALRTGLDVSFPVLRDDTRTLDEDLAELRRQRTAA